LGRLCESDERSEQTAKHGKKAGTAFQPFADRLGMRGIGNALAHSGEQPDQRSIKGAEHTKQGGRDHGTDEGGNQSIHGSLA
jgi:hypothetical protein